MPDKIKIPDVIERFVSYYTKNPVWGSLHIVLDDGNVEDQFLHFCIAHAEEKNDQEGAELGKILLQMSKTQRSKLPYSVDEFLTQRNQKQKETIMLNQDWLSELLTETESENPGTEAYQLQQLVKAFEDVMPEYTGLQGEELINFSENEDPSIEIGRLRNGLTDMAKYLSESQRIEIDNSVQVEVMKEVNAEFGVKPRI